MLDLSDRSVVRLRCEQCGREYDRVVVFAKRDSDAYAVVSAACHGHDDREVWIDATFGSWVAPYADHVTMSCRVSAAGTTAVDALVASRGDADYYGVRLTRDETLGHDQVDDLWALVDHVVRTVPEAREILSQDT